MVVFRTLQRETEISIHAALSYYFDYQQQIDQEIDNRREQEAKLREKLIRQGKIKSATDFRQRIEVRQAKLN